MAKMCVHSARVRVECQSCVLGGGGVEPEGCHHDCFLKRGGSTQPLLAPLLAFGIDSLAHS